MSVDTDVPQYTETQHIWRPRSSWLSILFSKTPFFPLVPLQLVASLLNLYVFLKTFSSLSKAYQSSLNFSISFTLPSTANVSTLTISASITSSYYLLFPFSTPQITLIWSALLLLLCLKPFKGSQLPQDSSPNSLNVHGLVPALSLQEISLMPVLLLRLLLSNYL